MEDMESKEDYKGMDEIEAVEDYKGMDEIEAVEDCKLILSQINKQCKECRLKRRWLMGMKLTKNESTCIKKLLPPKDGFLPESLLRQDDIYYEFLKNNILAASGENYNSKSPKEEKKDDEDEQYEMLFYSQNGLREIYGMLDGMTNEALCCFAKLLTGGSVNFGKTKIKRSIKESLQGVLKHKSNNQQQKIVQISKLLRDPMNYREKCLPHSSQSQHYRAAALRILDEIDNFPIPALRSMHRKLRSVKGYTPQIQSQRSGWSPAALVEQVRQKCMRFLSELEEEGPLQLPLAHALAVANLTVKLKSRRAPLTEFRKFSPEIDALQNDIMKVIWILDDEKKMIELEDLLLLLDPNAQPNKKSRILLRNLMTEYLLECADMDTIPERLLEFLAFVNKREDKVSCLSFSKEEIGAEVEGVLSISSQAKQIVWDFLPESENDLDIEFANAYLDDMLESDDDYFSDDGLELMDFSKNHIDSDDLYEQIEGFGESQPRVPNSIVSANNKEDNAESSIKNMNEVEYPLKSPLPSSINEQEENTHRIPANKYLSIQEACDNSSTVAYQLIGGLLTKFAEVEGLDLDHDIISYLQRKNAESPESELLSSTNAEYCSLVRVLEEQIQSEIIPSLPGSSMKKLKKIMT